jgi:hypothetical protein
MGAGERAEVGALNAQDHAKRRDEDVIFLEDLVPRGDAEAVRLPIQRADTKMAVRQ